MSTRDLGSIPGLGKSPGEWNGNPLQYSCLENPMNSMKKQKDRILKDELPRLVDAQYAMQKSGEITPERMKRWSQSKTTPSCGYDVVELKSDAIKNDSA